MTSIIEINFRFMFTILVFLSAPYVVVWCQSDIPPPVPKAPMTPNCGQNFPGSPGWNSCWEDFRYDMGVFQQNMAQYGAALQRQGAKNPSGSFSSNFNSFSGSSQSSMVSTNGYQIKTSNLPTSTTTQNGKITIRFPIQSFETFESKLDQNEIEIRVIDASNPRSNKWARIGLPTNVKPSDLKFDRTADSILIIGPVMTQNLGMTASMFSSGNFFPLSFPQMAFAKNPATSMAGFPAPAPVTPKPLQMWFF